MDAQTRSSWQDCSSAFLLASPCAAQVLAGGEQHRQYRECPHRPSPSLLHIRCCLVHAPLSFLHLTGPPAEKVPRRDTHKRKLSGSGPKTIGVGQVHLSLANEPVSQDWEGHSEPNDEAFLTTWLAVDSTNLVAIASPYRPYSLELGMSLALVVIEIRNSQRALP